MGPILAILAAPVQVADTLRLGEGLGFERPWLLLLLCLVPLLIWLHKEPARELATDRLELWARALARLGLRRRRRLPPSLLLAILAFLALALALAGAGRPERPGPRRFVVLLDRSASMATREDGTSRTTRAVAALEDELARIPPEVPGSLYECGPDRVVPLLEMPAGKPHSLPPELRTRLLASDPATLLATARRARTDLARALADKAGPDCAVLVYGDGAGPSPWPALRAAADDNLYLRGFGRADTSSPSSIVAAEFEDPWPAAELELAVEVARPLPSGAQLVLSSLDEGREKRFAFGQGSGDAPDGPMLLSLPRAFGREVEIRLEPGDGFGLDELLLCHVRAPWAPALRVLPFDDPDLRVLADFVIAELGAREERDEAAFAAAPEGLVLQEGGRLEAWPDDGRYRLCFGTLLPGAAAEGRPTGPLEWARGKPLLRDLDLSTLGVDEAVLAPPLEEGAEVLVRVGDAPFVVLWPARRLFWCGSELGRNRLVAQAFLPLLLLRALGSMLPGGEDGRIRGLLDPAEAKVAARPLPEPRPTPEFWRPRHPYWPFLVAGFALCLLLRATLVRR